MKLFCQQCGSPIAVEDVDLATLHARCLACDEVFSFDRCERDPFDGGRGPVPQPKSVLVEEAGGEFRMERVWYTPLIFLLLAFALFWDGFVLFWFSSASKYSAAFVLFGVPHAAIGVGLTYFVVISFFNRTVVRVAGHRLTVRHQPFPWPGGAEMDVGDIQQLYCQEKVRYGRHGGRHATFRLLALTVGGEKVVLVKGLREMDEALFLEQRLEGFLGIEDEPVGGELSR